MEKKINFRGVPLEVPFNERQLAQIISSERFTGGRDFWRTLFWREGVLASGFREGGFRALGLSGVGLFWRAVFERTVSGCRVFRA